MTKFVKSDKKIFYKNLIYNNEIIEYKIYKSLKYKNITIKPDENFNLVVLSPHHVPEDYLEKFVLRNIAQVQKSIAKIRNTRLVDLTYNHLILFGQKYKLIRLLTDQKTSKISLNNINSDKIYFYVGQSIGNDLKKQQKYVLEQVKRLSSNFLKSRVIYYCNKFDLAIPQIKIKIMKQKWGWCSSKKVIALNALLLAFEIDVIDHVICHELAHLTHMNHSKAFQQLLRHYDPDTDVVIKKIKFKLD